MNEILWNYFKSQNPLLLAKDLIRANRDKNGQVVSNINNGVIGLRNDINGNKIPENENSSKIVHIGEKMLEFNQ